MDMFTVRNVKKPLAPVVTYMGRKYGLSARLPRAWLDFFVLDNDARAAKPDKLVSRSLNSTFSEMIFQVENGEWSAKAYKGWIIHILLMEDDINVRNRLILKEGMSRRVYKYLNNEDARWIVDMLVDK